MKRDILHRILLLALLSVLSVAYVTGQNLYRVNRGSVHEYKVDKSTFAENYIWQVFTDLSLTVPANPAQAELIPLGTGRENEIQIKWNSTGDYYLMISVSTEAGCSNRMAWHFVVDPMEDKPIARILGTPLPILGNCDENGLTLDASESSGDGIIYNWSPSDYLDNPSSSKPVFHPGITTRYILTVTDTRGQTDTTSILVRVADAPKAVTDNHVFVNASNEAILLNGAQSYGTGITYLWLSADGIILNGETTPSAEVSGIGKYYLTVTDQYGCTDTDSVLVNRYTQAVKDTTSTEINFTVDINVLANDIPRNNLDPSTLRIVSAPKNGVATVVADSIIAYTPNQYYVGNDEFVYSICDYYENCDQATVLVIVNDIPFFIPEGFSPNGDGLNDEFEIQGLAKYKTVEITIFNRWGNVVYQSHNYGNGTGKEGFWNGTAKAGVRIGSGPVPSGTYFYVLKLDGKENMNGSVYLDR
ncbi:MAG: gliding motility-associated C-terminal domain-containing protein [Prolixibacteraceae bacterium]